MVREVSSVAGPPQPNALPWLAPAACCQPESHGANHPPPSSTDCAQALFQRRFEAGTILLALTRVDEADGSAGAWLISAAKVAVRPGWVPADPLHTWHNTAPFQGEAQAQEPPPEPLPAPALAGGTKPGIPGGGANKARSNAKPPAKPAKSKAGSSGK